MDNNFNTLIYNSEDDTFVEISEQSTTYDVTNNRIVKTTKNIYDNQRKLIKKIETQVKYIHNSVGTYSSISEETSYSPDNGETLGTKTIKEFYENGTLKKRSEEEKNTIIKDEDKTYIINKKEIYTHGEMDTLKKSNEKRTLNPKGVVIQVVSENEIRCGSSFEKNRTDIEYTGDGSKLEKKEYSEERYNGDELKYKESVEEANRINYN